MLRIPKQQLSESIDSCQLSFSTGADACALPPQGRRPRVRLTKDYLRDLVIGGLRQEMAAQKKLLDMLLVLVDPEDVASALQLRRITPPNSVLLKIAEEMGQPDGLPEEPGDRPW